jgi:RNase H-fold protein (predicted Holliday junction resolvase)
MGLAVGTPSVGMAGPLAIVAYEGAARAAEEIVRRAEEIGATAVVIGRPTDVEGRDTPACRRSDAIAAALRDSGLTVEFQREYLTSREARQRARDGGRKPTDPVDDLAAVVILEEFLAR